MGHRQNAARVQDTYRDIAILERRCLHLGTYSLSALKDDRNPILPSGVNLLHDEARQHIQYQRSS